MKIAAQIVLWGLSIFFGYQIYKSVSGPLEFKKVKEKRFAKVISRLKDISKSEEAYRVVNGKYTSNYDSLVHFIENGQFTITSQRDTSWMEYDPIYKIDMPKEGKIIDTLGFVSIKDSLFKNSDRYKKMMYVPYTDDSKKFELEAKTIEKNGYQAPVFQAKVHKEVLLQDQPKDLVAQELTTENITEDIKGPEIIVGSLEEVSTSGNWPTIYDAKTNNNKE
ncbi:hypothetical protein SAMN05216480_10396 [Pustulibacterium marinum]|uniref:Uncharacterized protein n=1 Tax=Pustulibacterium marinum TaxID=1224947 RepID=A0A1I7G2G2_9FLAO|nr:hypothetical protein [Pustulibacterium marinum]SFU42655.1 hypothetical protein SAMN05216480_10396 [Pustulibacterium marinum]